MLLVQHAASPYRRMQLARRTRCRRNFRQPKIQNLRVPALGHKNIRRLDVAMHNSFGVRRIQRIGNLNRQRKQRLGLHRSPRNAMLQRHAIQKLHGDKRVPVFFANVINRANIRMVQRRTPPALPA